MSKNTSDYENALLDLNMFMVEQTGINDYGPMVRAIVNQVGELVNPVFTVFNEYDKKEKVLRIKEIKAKKGVLDIGLKIAGKKLLSTVSPVNDFIYEEITAKRISILPTLHDASNGSISKAVSYSIGKALNIKCYLIISFIVDGQVYGTTSSGLKGEPDHYSQELLKTYAYFTSISLKRVIAEEALSKSLQEIKTITENMTDIVAMSDAEGRFTYLSGNQYNFYGYKKDELIGKYVWDIIYAEDIYKMSDLFKKHLSTGEAGQAEYRLVKKDGSLVWVDTAGSVLKKDGKTVGALLVTRDVTERKKVETELKRLALIIKNSSELVNLASLDGNMLFLNESGSSMLGIKLQGLEKYNIMDVIPEKQKRFVKNEVLPAIMKKDRWEGDLQYRNILTNAVTDVHTLTFLIKDEESGMPLLLANVSRDITERKKAEEEIKKTKEQYQSLVGNIPGITYRCKMDKDWTMLYISDNVYQVTGYPASDFINNAVRTYESIIHRDDNTNVKVIYEAVKQRRDYNIYYRVYHKNGSIRWVNEKARAVYDDSGQVMYVDGLILDITEQKNLDQKIRHISFHDQLTDLYNRHYLEQCKEELKEISVSIIMTDINGLKLINDTYGHEAGDELLKIYAGLLKKSFKQSDLFFRWGGDEFIIILKNTGEAKSWMFSNRLTKHCSETIIKDIPLSISIGISSKYRGADIDKAIKEAEDMMYKNKLTESKSSKNLIMKTLLNTLSEKSFETKEHIERMNLVGRQFAKWLSLPPTELSRLETLIMLHDIGKINIDGHILLKKTAMTIEEWQEIKKHPEVGYRITRTAEDFAHIAEEILTHHERWDGNGYPQGLQGESIPYLSRILNIVDSYDVMSNGRPYKRKMSADEIIDEIERCSGKQYDPVLAKEFVIFLRKEII